MFFKEKKEVIPEKPKNKDIYKMELHDTIRIGDDCVVRKVPGGWVYCEESAGGDALAPVFVPENK